MLAAMDSLDSFAANAGGKLARGPSGPVAAVSTMRPAGLPTGYGLPSGNVLPLGIASTSVASTSLIPGRASPAVGVTLSAGGTPIVGGAASMSLLSGGRVSPSPLTAQSPLPGGSGISSNSMVVASGGVGIPAIAVPTIPVMKPSGSKCTSVETVSFGEDMNARFRSTMEDTAVVVDGYGGDAATGYFGIYDGHGGRNVAEFLRLHLHVNLEKELRAKGERSMEECLKAAFLLTDVECRSTGEQASGSTAIVCVVRRQGPKRYVYTANVGDARAVLCHAGSAVRLSRDHKATDPAELMRIEAAGGFVLRKRVMGVLAVARSFGDFVLKPFVPADPYTSTTKLDAMSSFIIIACDGVWDVMEDQEAVDLVRAHVAGGPSRAKTAAQALVDSALSKGSTDNVTALVVFL